MARSGDCGTVAVVLEPAVDGALRVDAIEADADGLEVPALGCAADGLGVEAEQLGQLARLVVPFDHRLVSAFGVNGGLTSIAPSQKVEIIAEVRIVLDMRAVR